MKTLSEKQLAANRANAAKSTGPRTREGKLRASLNARKHGLAAATFTVEGIEESEELQNLIDDAVSVYEPRNSQEQFAVERIAICQLAILRAYRLEAGALTNCFASGVHTPDRISYPHDPLPQRNNRPLTTGFEQKPSLSSFALILRYQAQADRQYRRAVEDLERLIAQRGDIPNEPIPEENKEDPPRQPRVLGRGLNALPANRHNASLRVSVPPCQSTSSPNEEAAPHLPNRP